MAARRRIDSGSEFERRIGYSRAVVAGGWVMVSGTTGFEYRAMTIPDRPFRSACAADDRASIGSLAAPRGRAYIEDEDEMEKVSFSIDRDACIWPPEPGHLALSARHDNPGDGTEHEEVH